MDNNKTAMIGLTQADAALLHGMLIQVADVATADLESTAKSVKNLVKVFGRESIVADKTRELLAKKQARVDLINALVQKTVG